MAREFFKNLPSQETPFNASRWNGLLNGEEAMGSIVVEDITCKNIADIEDVKVNGSEEINRKIYNVKPNTEYTLSYTKSRISGVTITQATIWGIRKITFYDKNGTQLSTLAGTTISLPENSSKKCSLTFTTPANTSYVECRLDNNNGDSNVNTLVSNVQLEPGPVATNYVEHKEFSNKQIYSTNEQVIGTWVDGKPLYRKIFNINTPSSENTDTLIANTLIPNVSKVVKLDGCLVSNNIWYPINHYYDSAYNSCAYYFPTGNNGLKMKVSSNYKNVPAYVTIEYTKTTD